MAKTTKTTATTASASPVPAASTASASTASAPVKVVKASKEPKEVKEPKTPKAPKEPAAAVAAPAATTDAAASTTEDSSAPSTESVIASQFSSISAKLQQVVAFAAALRSELRALERHAVKEIRTAQKASAKKRRKVGNRAPSGFVKPTPISKELAEFLGKTDGSEMARTEVTREINAYIRNNSLQDKENGRRINPDAQTNALNKCTKQIKYNKQMH